MESRNLKEEIVARLVTHRWIDIPTPANAKHTKAVVSGTVFVFKMKPRAPTGDCGRLNSGPSQRCPSLRPRSVLPNAVKATSQRWLSLRILSLGEKSSISGNLNIITGCLKREDLWSWNWKSWSERLISEDAVLLAWRWSRSPEPRNVGGHEKVEKTGWGPSQESPGGNAALWHCEVSSEMPRQNSSLWNYKKCLLLEATKYVEICDSSYGKRIQTFSVDRCLKGKIWCGIKKLNFFLNLYQTCSLQECTISWGCCCGCYLPLPGTYLL